MFLALRGPVYGNPWGHRAGRQNNEWPTPRFNLQCSPGALVHPVQLKPAKLHNSHLETKPDSPPFVN